MKLALGTAQFGLPYGVANTRGRPDDEAVARILRLAAVAGVRVIDTAALYGFAEEVLGRCLPLGHAFDLVTKTPKFGGMNGIDAVLALRSAFEKSCAKLRAERVFGLLAHDANDLLSAAGETLWREMLLLRAAGRVVKVGASVYSGNQIDALLQRYPLDLVQLPISLLDQRLLHGGQLDRLRASGVEVHARSAFLQGALLMPVDVLPPHLAALRPNIERIASQAAGHGMNTLTAAMRFVSGLPQVAAVVCGVDGVDQFEQLVHAMQSSDPALSLAESAACACDEEILLDPSQWAAA